MDLQKVSAEQRLHYVKIGKQFGSLEVRDAAEVLLAGCEKHAEALEAFGFDPTQAQALRGLVRQYPADLERRALTQEARATLGGALRRQLKQARQLRLQGKARLMVASLNTDLSEDVRAAVERAQDTTAHLKDKEDADAVAAQLKAIEAALAQVAPKEALRGALSAGMEALEQAREAHNLQVGTVADTEQLNLLDGVIVTYMRAANRVAKAAAKALGQPAIAHDLSLKKLNG